ncbi:MAG: toll/interleukin-1 receptor domain-containing protein [Oscillibacter sp.]|nr:toll/interleukin-1 receptor domain-containing protein [Oscillibacter sp.]
MADVFISYHEDSTGEKSAGQLVPKIADALESVGISCWYAQRDLSFGTFASAITREIDTCKIFLLVLNKESNKSAYVESEVHLAFDRMHLDRQHNIQSMLPVLFRVDNCALSDSMRFYTGIFQITDGTFLDSQRIGKLVKRIHDCLPALDSGHP